MSVKVTILTVFVAVGVLGNGWAVVQNTILYAALALFFLLFAYARWKRRRAPGGAD